MDRDRRPSAVIRAKYVPDITLHLRAGWTPALTDQPAPLGVWRLVQKVKGRCAGTSLFQPGLIPFILVDKSDTMRIS